MVFTELSPPMITFAPLALIVMFAWREEILTILNSQYLLMIRLTCLSCVNHTAAGRGVTITNENFKVSLLSQVHYICCQGQLCIRTNCLNHGLDYVLTSGFLPSIWNSFQLTLRLQC